MFRAAFLAPAGAGTEFPFQPKDLWFYLWWIPKELTGLSPGWADSGQCKISMSLNIISIKESAWV